VDGKSMTLGFSNDSKHIGQTELTSMVWNSGGQTRSFGAGGRGVSPQSLFENAHWPTNNLSHAAWHSGCDLQNNRNIDLSKC
jgi:hypothetical protein